MHNWLPLDTSNAYPIVFVAVLLDVLVVPWIAIPVLLMAGGLAAAGKLSLFLAIGFAVAAAVVGDTLWYTLGRYEGLRLLTLVNRLSGEKQTYLWRSLRLIRRHGVSFLLVSKFVPVMAFLACPAAGLLNISWFRFLLTNALTRVLWAAGVCSLGYLSIL